MDRILYKGQELFSPKLDLIFKALFGREDSKDILIEFLNGTLNLGISSTDEISLTNTELSEEHPTDKLSRLDVRVLKKGNIHIDIEIQLVNQGDMIERSVYYVSKLFVAQLKEGETYKELGKAITLNLIDFTIFEDERFMHTGRLCDIESHEEFTDCIEVNFIELNKVPDIATNDTRTMWAMFLNADSEEDLIMLSQKNNGIKKAVEKLQSISADDELRYKYDMRTKAMLDHRSMVRFNREEGLNEGRIEGSVEATKAIAKKMKDSNVDIDIIVTTTGLDKDQILSL